MAALTTCYGIVRTWGTYTVQQQEWYETVSRDAARRARALRRAGFHVLVGTMGQQVTPVGLVGMTLLTVVLERGAPGAESDEDVYNVPEPDRLVRM